MVLADTSIWVAHFRNTDVALSALLERGQVLMHPYVLGELVCRNLKNRDRLIDYFGELPTAIEATNAEAIALVRGKKLWGSGIGWIDVHLLASALLSGSALWTLDVRLQKAAAASGLQFPISR